MNDQPRFAIYLAPEPQEKLWSFGSSWIGYDAQTRASLKHPALPGITPEAIHEATEHPRLYGLHVTVKAPFRLMDGVCVSELEDAAEELACRHHPIGPFSLVLEERKVGEANLFLCLAPAEKQPALHRLEADAVVTLDPFRAPLTLAEVSRRRPDRLGRTELGYLQSYGYPYVLDAFQPHISLTGPIAPDSPLRTGLAQRLNSEADLMQFAARSLLIFEQPEPGARFYIRQRYRLGAKAAKL
jgi:hypothetical protein